MARYVVWYQEPEFGCIVTNDEDGYFDYDYAKQKFDEIDSPYKRLVKVTQEVLEEVGEQE